MFQDGYVIRKQTDAQTNQHYSSALCDELNSLHHDDGCSGPGAK